ncbi:MAG: thermonuclease family protein [Pseudomonadota bacterium]
MVAVPLAAFSATFLAPKLGDGMDALAAEQIAAPADSESAYFPVCNSDLRFTCIVDGDTIWYRGDTIRIADIDTPEISNPRCDNEARLGQRATSKLQGLLNEAPFSLEPLASGPGQDRYGRTLRVVTRDGESLGSVLVSAGLAERWGGPRVDWCA